MGRPRQHDETTRVALLEAAEQLVAAGGLDAVGVRPVAERAGTSTRAVYALFGSREGLMQALAVRAFQLLGERVDAVPTTEDAGEDLVRSSLGFRSFALEHPDLFRLFFNATTPIDAFGTGVRSASSAAYQQLIRRVYRAHSAGLVGDHTVVEVVLLWDALCSGLAIREVCGMIDPEHAEDAWLDGLHALLAGLAASSPQFEMRPGTQIEASQ